MRLRRLFVVLRSKPVVSRIVPFALGILGSCVPRDVKTGSGFELVHGGVGVVIHSRTEIGDDVRIYQGVTIGRSNVWESANDDFQGFLIEDGCVLGAGAVVLGSSGLLVMGAGTILGANAVLRESTQPYSIWAGNPARCVGSRSQ